MKRNIYFLFLLFSSLLLCCCKDKDNTGPSQPQLPPITTSGKNTFGCLVNGEVWLPQIKPRQLFQHPLTSSYENGGFYLQATKDIDAKILQGINIIINGMYSEQFYSLYSNSLFENSGAYSDVIIDCLAFTDSIYTGKVQILKLDVENKIIAGTFHMKLWNPDCDTINITDGRFDVKFAY